MRYLALGDSYTIGEGVAAHERWPNVLAGLLRERGHVFPDPEIVARTAWTTDELLDAMADAPPRGPFDLVSVMTGVNDQYRARPVGQFETGFRELLEEAVRQAGGAPARVLVISIPDWGATPFAAGRDRALISREIDLYNARARSITTETGARYHDVTDLSRRMVDDDSLVISDGLHPSGKAYRQWALSLMESVEELISSALRR